MKKNILSFTIAASLICALATGCGSEKKASGADSVSATAPTVPDTTRSPATHMDTSKKPPR